jgi:hypothetical protein
LSRKDSYRRMQDQQEHVLPSPVYAQSSNATLVSKKSSKHKDVSFEGEASFSDKLVGVFNESMRQIRFSFVWFAWICM